MVKRSSTLETLVSTKTKCIKLIFIGKITLISVAFLMALSISKCLQFSNPCYNSFLVYCRELAPSTIRLTGDQAQGDNSKHDSHSNPLLHNKAFEISYIRKYYGKCGANAPFSITFSKVFKTLL